MDKLFLDQPETFTTRGHVEHYVDNSGYQVFSERTGHKSKPKPKPANRPMLLNEAQLRTRMRLASFR